MEFSDRLRELRMQRGISQSKLAEEIHISRSAVAKWENGIGLPNEESLRLLAEYFEVPYAELSSNQERETVLVEKNVVIKRQKKVIAALSAVLCAALIGAAAFWYPPFREYVFPFVLGILFTLMGVFNMRGNIATIHWYNRRKVRKEDQKAYCFVMGLGTVFIGIGTMLFSILFAVFPAAWVEYGSLAVMGLGFVLMLYAQFRYNRGVF